MIKNRWWIRTTFYRNARSSLQRKGARPSGLNDLLKHFLWHTLLNYKKTVVEASKVFAHCTVTFSNERCGSMCWKTCLVRCDTMRCGAVRCVRCGVMRRGAARCGDRSAQIQIRLKKYSQILWPGNGHENSAPRCHIYYRSDIHKCLNKSGVSKDIRIFWSCIIN